MRVSRAGPLQRYGDEGLVSSGKSTLGPSTFRKWQDSTYDFEYSGIEWKPGTHLALGMSIPSTNRYGNSFVVDNGVSLAYENNKSAACTVVRTDKLTNKTATARFGENAFGLNRIICDDALEFGYRIVLKPVALEPYLGFALLEWEFDFLGGSEMNSKTLSVSRWGFGGRPTLGGKVYVGSFFLQVQSCSYSKPLVNFGVPSDDYIDYATNIKGSFLPGKASSLSISIGTLW
jgi:hypothetical protein